jgi:hypothetical protein
MANLYVASTGSNTSPYDTWAKAATAPLTATAAAAAGDTIYQHAETFTISADTTYTLANGVRWICTNDKVNEPPQTLSTSGVIDGTGTAGVDIVIAGGGAGFSIDGITFRTGNGTSSSYILVADSDNCFPTLANCVLELAGTASSSRIYMGNFSNTRNHVVRLINTSVKVNSSSHSVQSACRILWENSDILASGSTVPTSFISAILRGGGAGMLFTGCDFSRLTSGTVFAPSAPDSPVLIELSRCKLGTATLNNTLTLTGLELLLQDCSSSDIHYQFAHYSYLGSTTISTSIYANDGAEYDVAGNKHSWVVAGNANTTRASPYVSPWITRYNEATSAITPELEIVRDGSSSAFTDIEVWSEWCLKTAGGSPLATLYSDYGGHLSSGTAQGNGIGLSEWTGESGTAWSGRLECPSVTPAEIGHISARVVVAGNHTVYVDPQIRGL